MPRPYRKPSTPGPPPGLQRPPRRFILTVAVVFILAIILILSTSSSVPKPPTDKVPSVHDITEKAHKAADSIPKPKLPKLYNPFGDVAHQPPEEQANSSHGETKWYSDLKWLQNPFSSSVTLDENRALLPPLPHRTPIYTYYDTSGQKPAATVDAEHQMLLTWRRAWWAQGFKPIVLGHPEAAKSPLYSRIKDMTLDPALKSDLERFLAWSHMGCGILANWLVLPMAGHDDPTLGFLRRGDFPELTSYKALKGGIMAGKKELLDRTLEQILDNTNLKKAGSVFELIPTKSLNTVSGQEGLAYYDLPTITANYKVVANQLSSQSQASGLKLLQQLINAHLHTTWQSSFPGGLAVLQPYPQRTHALVSYAARLAHDLIQCPKSPMTDSCPPNKPSCKICASYNSKLPLHIPGTFENKTSVFTIGTVPHPYTFTSLFYRRDVLTAKFIRRDTVRDFWLQGATKDLLGTKLGGPQRLPPIKEAVAGSFATHHTVWVTAELEEQMHRDWVFGFSLPHDEKAEDWHGITKEIDVGKDAPTEHDLSEEYRRLNRAKNILKKKSKIETESVEMVEAWNLADSEVWRFVRAFATRRRVERLAWEEEERKFAGAERRGTGWGSWLIGA